MRKQAIISHASSKDHLKNMFAAHETPPVTAAISCSQPPIQESSTSTAALSTLVDAPSTNSASGFSISSYLLDNQITRAEIFYCLKIVKSLHQRAQQMIHVRCSEQCSLIQRWLKNFRWEEQKHCTLLTVGWQFFC